MQQSNSRNSYRKRNTRPQVSGLNSIITYSSSSSSLICDGLSIPGTRSAAARSSATFRCCSASFSSRYNSALSSLDDSRSEMRKSRSKSLNLAMSPHVSHKPTMKLWIWDLDRAYGSEKPSQLGKEKNLRLEVRERVLEQSRGIFSQELLVARGRVRLGRRVEQRRMN